MFRWVSDLIGTKLSEFWIGRAKFDSSELSADRTLTVPNKSGTLAMLDDVTGGTVTQITIDFGSSGYEPESLIMTIADTGITTTSKIFTQVIAPSSGRDLDEMEMEQFTCAVGNIVNGVSFDLIVTCLSGGAHGQYLVNYSR